jgi:hypothetical protein
MAATQRAGNMSPGLLKVMERGVSLHKPLPTEEPDGGNLLVRIWRGPRLGNWPGLPYNLVRFARGGGTRDATRRKSSSPVKSRCVVPSGSGRFMR